MGDYSLTPEEITQHALVAGDLQDDMRVFTIQDVEDILRTRAVEELRAETLAHLESGEKTVNQARAELAQVGVFVHCPACSQRFNIVPKPIQVRVMDMPFNPMERLMSENNLDDEEQDIVELASVRPRRHYTYKQIVVQFEPFRIPNHACNPRYVGR